MPKRIRLPDVQVNKGLRQAGFPRLGFFAIVSFFVFSLALVNLLIKCVHIAFMHLCYTLLQVSAGCPPFHFLLCSSAPFASLCRLGLHSATRIHSHPSLHDRGRKQKRKKRREGDGGWAAKRQKGKRTRCTRGFFLNRASLSLYLFSCATARYGVAQNYEKHKRKGKGAYFRNCSSYLLSCIFILTPFT